MEPLDSYQIFKAHIAQFVSLDDDEFDRFYETLTPFQVKRKEILVQAGEVANYAYFLVEGCMRYYYVTNGEEQIGQFFFEGAWAGALFSFLSREPSRMYFDAIEDSVLLGLNNDRIQRTYTEIPKLERFGRMLVEKTFISSQQRSASFLTQSPTEKYQHLVATRPKVVARIPQYMIASYLGIKPESLSRIRKKIAREEKQSGS